MKPLPRCLPLCLLAAIAATPLPAQGSAANDRPASLFRQGPPPVYPEALIPYRIRGEVRLRFDIDTEGAVTNVRALYATHPDFVAPAIEAAQAWRYRTALQNGRPVVTYDEEAPVVFDAVIVGARPFSVPYPAEAGLPEQYRYDRPPSILTVVPVVYPYELLVAGVAGNATVAFGVGPDGRVLTSMVRSASHPDFGYALAAAMEAWTFEPAQKNGAPSAALLQRAQEFLIDGKDLLVGDSARRLLRELARPQPDIAEPEDLDAIPAIRSGAPPPYPANRAGQAGRAEIEFIVDRTGRVQLPRIVSASQPEFGWAAITAAARWLFEVPMRGGRPADVRVRVPVEFPGAGPAADSGAP